MKVLINFIVWLFLTIDSSNENHFEKLNGSVVGILTVPTSKKDSTFSSSSFSMIPGSYVKWLEQTGIRIIPIRYDMPKKFISHIMHMINGVLITGGAADLFKNNSRICRFKRILSKKTSCPSQYMRTVDFITKKAIQMGKKGNKLPV